MKRLLRKSLRKAGLELTRFRPQASEWAQLKQMLSVHDVRTVFDIGANTGQYASSLRDSGFQGKIVSFEPVLEAHTHLSRAADKDPLWNVPERMAIGDREGRVEIHVSENLVSSSTLPMLNAHRDAAPRSHFIASEMVPIRRLDDVAEVFLGDDEEFFIKVDVQGAESQVLDGAPHLLKRAAGLQLELSLVSLYEGEALFEPMLERLRDSNFDLWSLVPGFIDDRNGRLLQCDGIFFRRPTNL
ncbi:MAG TPA: FkbM family methyltransferase [Candidatus Acidoferrum sp.]|jgi:FkbM family methyltransferase